MSTYLPEELMVKTAVDALKSVVDDIKEVNINREYELTRREAIRQEARVAIAQIESDTSKYFKELECSHNERMEIIKMFGEYIKNGNPIPEVVQTYALLMKEMGVGNVNEK